jgi:1-acyl-sn-glycerol-3-phosphate acyltransferase
VLQRFGRRLFILGNLIVYWGLLPWAILVAARSVDRALHLPLLPHGVGIALAIFGMGTGLLLALWAGAVLFLCGGGLPIALLPPVRLVREGPYAVSRHPLYLAFSATLLAWAGVSGSIGMLVLLPGVVLVWTVYTGLHEDPVLLRRYTSAYQAYRREVPFFLGLSRRATWPGLIACLVYLIAKSLAHAACGLRVEGREHLPLRGPAIVVANHAGYLDPIFLIVAANRPIRFVTTGEMSQEPFKRWLFKHLGSITIQRYRSDPQAVREVLHALHQDEIVGLFPEAERSWDGNPLPVSRAVRHLLRRVDAPILPARIEGSYAVLPRWASSPLPARVEVRFFPPRHALSPEHVEEILGTIRGISGGRTSLQRSTRGLERLVWACPRCKTIGAIASDRRGLRCRHCGASWRLSRGLELVAPDGERTALARVIETLPAPGAIGALTSQGPVDLLQGGDTLHPIVTGPLDYREGVLRVADRTVPLSTVRTLPLEGRNRLDLGLSDGTRIRLRFHEDSALLWQRILARAAGIESGS